MKRSVQESLLVLADAIEEAGDGKLARLLQEVAAGEGLQHDLIKSIAAGNWNMAFVHAAKLEMIQQGLPADEEALNQVIYDLTGQAVATHEAILEDDWVEIHDAPRVFMAGPTEGPQSAYVSGWFYVDPDAVEAALYRGHTPGDRPTWDELDHEDQRRVLSDLTGAAGDSLRWTTETALVHGRPRGIAHVGMQRSYGELRWLINRAIEQGYIRGPRRGVR